MVVPFEKMSGEPRGKGRIKDSIVTPGTMSHGTVEVFKPSESRRFHEELLLHSPPEPGIRAQEADA
jgi:hypothetical protein